MTKSEARQISEKHRFSKLDCCLMLKEALNSKNDSFWEKPSSNPMLDMGSYFNLCVKWVGYKEGENNNEYVSKIVAFRVLRFFGEYCKIQPLKSRKGRIEIKVSERPSLS